MTSTRQPAIFLPHGGGPCFFMDPPADDPSRWLALHAYLAALPDELPARPDALLVISAHWETPRPTVLAAAKPAMLYDYYNFPAHTYQIQYPAPGDPALAARVRALLAMAGIDSAAELERGYDHGVFVPLKVSFPNADIPIVQLSMQSGLDPATHLAIGRALSALRDDNILVIGSGLSFHNLAGLGNPGLSAPSAEFDRWLTHAVCDVPSAERDALLSQWTQAPFARLCHPREEHLLPLMVAVGAAGGAPGRHTYSGRIWGKSISAYQFD
jgi:aromatic ring-opening dioxygenase catalytic subunit (LigB family)